MWAPEPVWMRWWGEKFPVSVGTRTPDYPTRSSALFDDSMEFFE